MENLDQPTSDLMMTIETDRGKKKSRLDLPLISDAIQAAVAIFSYIRRIIYSARY